MWTVHVHAEDDTPGPRARLTYQRAADAEACPTEASFRHAVESRLGYDPFRGEGAVAIRVSLRRVDRKLRGDVSVQYAPNAAPGTRVLYSDGGDCAELAASLAIAVSIAVDPQSLTRPPRDVTAPLPELDSPLPPTAPTAPTAAVAVVSAAPTEVLSRRWESRPQDPTRLMVGVGFATSVLAAPTVVLSPLVEVGVRWKRASLSLELRDEIGATNSQLGKADVHTSLPLASLAVCAYRGAVLLCGFGAGGVFLASTDSGISPVSESRAFAQLGARLGYEAELSSVFSLRIAGDLRVPLTRPRLRFDGAQVWEPPTFFNLSLELTGLAHF